MSEISLIQQDSKHYADSREIAKHFNKRHDNVIQAIRNLNCSSEFHSLNFKEVIFEFKNGKGGIQNGVAYNVSRDGFSFLVMGFTGKAAAEWKEKYIAAFNKMEEAILAQRKSEITNEQFKKSRLGIVQTFVDHGVNSPKEIAGLTNYQYASLLRKTAKTIKAERNPNAKTARELLDQTERRLIAAQEALTGIRADITQADGFSDLKDCISASNKAIQDFTNQSAIKAIEAL